MPARVTTDIDALRTDVCAAVAGFDARVLDRGVAVNALREWAAIAHAAQTAASLAAARVAECGPPPSAGARDASEYIAKETGTTAAKAEEHIETGTLLQGHDIQEVPVSWINRKPEMGASSFRIAKVAPDYASALLHLVWRCWREHKAGRRKAGVEA